MNHRMLLALRQTITIIACVLMLSTAMPGLSLAQDAQPTKDPAELAPNDPTAPQPSGSPTPKTASPTEPVAQPTKPPASNPSNTNNNTSGNNSNSTTTTVSGSTTATSPGAPAVLAHGAAYVSGDDLVWQAAEVNVPAPASAKSENGDEAILFQRDGSTVIRNDATGKRAIMAPGEAYFRTSDDNYTIMSQGGSSTVWQFELADPDAKNSNAFYASPVIKNVREGVYDMRLIRYVLNPDDAAELPENSGAGLVMVATGQVEVTNNGQRSALNVSDGQSIGKTATIKNTSQQPAVVLYVSLGEKVDENTAGSAQGSQGAVSGNATPSARQNTSGTGQPLQGQSGSSTPGAEQAPSSQGDPTNGGVTSINVTAIQDIYLVISVDGTTVFDGPLPAGASSGPIVGAKFEVYTSSGANTQFTNACGATFKMGDEPGDANYVLTYDPATSCPPR